MPKLHPTYGYVAGRYSPTVAAVFMNERRRYSSGLVDATAADRAALAFTLRWLRRTSERGSARWEHFFR